jgi:Tfp pilus assembly protein PilN
MSTLIAEPLTAQPAAVLPAWKRISAFGTGFGIVAGVSDLYAAIVRARPSGPALVAETVVAGFRTRPAAEWGAELSRFISSSGESSLAATVLLPRHEVIVRTLNLPGVADKDAASAIELQIDTLHPYGDDEVAWGWSRAGADSVIVGIVRRILLEGYETLFSEAGIPLAAVTFSPTVIHSALRIWSAGPASVLCPIPAEPGQPENRTEIYGESPSRAIYSAEFSMPGERALAVTRAELRLPAELTAGTLAAALPQSRGLAPASITAYAAALAGSVPRIAKFGNLLPADRRASHDRVQYLLPGLLGLLLGVALLVFFVVLPAVGERRYRNELNQAAQRLEPAAARARALEKSTDVARAKITTLDDFRQRPQLDLDSLNELTRLLPPPVWTNSIEIYPDSIFITGEAENAAPLLKILDSSPLFQNSEFVSSVVRTQQGEQFRIKITRRGRAGRSTP